MRPRKCKSVKARAQTGITILGLTLASQHCRLARKKTEVRNKRTTGPLHDTNCLAASLFAIKLSLPQKHPLCCEPPVRLTVVATVSRNLRRSPGFNVSQAYAGIVLTDDRIQQSSKACPPRSTLYKQDEPSRSQARTFDTVSLSSQDDSLGPACLLPCTATGP